jgi:hypothetical protein
MEKFSGRECNVGDKNFMCKNELKEIATEALLFNDICGE